MKPAPDNRQLTCRSSGAWRASARGITINMALLTELSPSVSCGTAYITTWNNYTGPQQVLDCSSGGGTPEEIKACVNGADGSHDNHFDSVMAGSEAKTRDKSMSRMTQFLISHMPRSVWPRRGSSPNVVWKTLAGCSWGCGQSHLKARSCATHSANGPNAFRATVELIARSRQADGCTSFPRRSRTSCIA
jgi:hypothetical protein